jgi:hypothetical protein
MFLTNASFRQNYATSGPVMVCLNLASKKKSTNCTAAGNKPAQRLSQSRRISRGVCASSESPTWTTSSFVCSTTLRRNCRRSPRKFGHARGDSKMLVSVVSPRKRPSWPQTAFEKGTGGSD